MSGGKLLDLLDQLEHILESDPLIDEVGFIHPSQFLALSEEVGDSLSSAETAPQSADGIMKSKLLEAYPSYMVFWSKDHKLGISTEVLLPLYNMAKHAFMEAYERSKTFSYSKQDVCGDVNVLSHSSSSLNILESEIMKHSRALLLLSCDFGTAWNSRKLIVSKKQHLPLFMDELLLSALVLSFYPKSERAWSHRRWVIRMIAGKHSNLQEIVGKESELVEKIAEKSKMNYRAWNHRCWLVSYMSVGQVLHELNKTREWAGLHVADNSCFHYRSMLMLRILEDSRHKQDPSACYAYDAVCQVWKEELEWDGMLIKRYIGREALWLHRRFLSLCWTRHLAIHICDISDCSDHGSSMNHDIGSFLDNELKLFSFCSTIPDSGFEDYQAQAMFSATYMLWLTRHIHRPFGVELQRKLGAEPTALLNRICPEKACVWDSFEVKSGGI